MKINFNVEYELTKEKVYDEFNEVIREYVFVVPAEWLSYLYKNYIITKFDYEGVELEEFLDVYDCEVEGRYLYTLAKAMHVVIEEGWAEIAEY